jgi:hypothetical protein
LLLLAAAGCAATGVECRDGPAAPAEAPLPPAARTALEPMILSGAMPAADLPPLPGPTAYRSLTPHDCRCRAVRNAPVAGTLDAERRKLEESSHPQCSHLPSERARALRREMLLYTALEIRNRAAGQALEWYHDLAGAEAKAELLAGGLAEAREVRAQAEDLLRRGLRLPVDVEVLRRQVIDARLEQALTEVTLVQLNGRLRGLVAPDLAPTERLWPDLTAPAEAHVPDDVEAAVAVGLAYRPELLLVRAVLDHLDRATLAEARLLLQSINAMLGAEEPGSSCKCLSVLARLLCLSPSRQDEVEAARKQLQDYLAQREREVADEVRVAVTEARGRLPVVVLARERAHRWEIKVDDLKEKSERGMTVFAELATARQDWLKARGEVVKEWVAWQVAAVKVGLAQGVLPLGCEDCPGAIGQGCCAAPTTPLLTRRACPAPAHKPDAPARGNPPVSLAGASGLCAPALTVAGTAPSPAQCGTAR